MHERLHAATIGGRDAFLHELTRYLVDHADIYLIGVPESVIHDLKSLKAAVQSSLEHLDHALYFDVKPGVVSALRSFGKYTALLAEGKTCISTALTLIALETSASAASSAAGGKAGLIVLGWIAKLCGFAINPILGIAVAGTTAFCFRRVTKIVLTAGKKELGGYNDLARNLENIQHAEDQNFKRFQESKANDLANRSAALDSACKSECQAIHVQAERSWQTIRNSFFDARCDFYNNVCAGLGEIASGQCPCQVLASPQLDSYPNPISAVIVRIGRRLRYWRMKKEVELQRKLLLLEIDLERGFRRLDLLFTTRVLTSPAITSALESTAIQSQLIDEGHTLVENSKELISLL